MDKRYAVRRLLWPSFHLGIGGHKIKVVVNERKEKEKYEAVPALSGGIAFIIYRQDALYKLSTQMPAFPPPALMFDKENKYRGPIEEPRSRGRVVLSGSPNANHKQKRKKETSRMSRVRVVKARHEGGR